MSGTILNTLKLKGSVDDIQNINKNKEYSLGDIIYSQSNRGIYIYTNNGKFERLESYNGIPITQHQKIKPHPTNCVNCGAVLKDYKCEYCGTEYPRY